MRILFAVDIRESDLNRRLDDAIGWGEKLGAKLDLLFITPQFADSRYVGSDMVRLQADVQRILDRMRLELEKLQQRIPAQLRGEIEVAIAPRTGEAIVKRAEKDEKYGLLLLHTHGRTGLTQFFLGSVAERVVRISKVPTLVLRAPE